MDKTEKSRVKALKRKKIIRQLKIDRQLYLMLLLPVIYLIVFKLYPMYGLQIVFKDFSARKGITGSPWCDPLFKNFTRFFADYNFGRIIRNTLTLSIYSLIAGFPIPIIFALAIHYTNNRVVKKTVQMATYIPHFISVVVIVGIINQLFSSRGIVNQVIEALGMGNVDFLGSPKVFPHLYVWSGIWQSFGYSSIIYISTLSGVDPNQHEAAMIDGANKLQRMRYIDIPAILPTMVTLLILNSGRILEVGREKVFLMQNSVNISQSQIISTYVYSLAFGNVPQFAYSATVGMVNGLVGLILIMTVNKIADKVADSAIF